MSASTPSFAQVIMDALAAAAQEIHTGLPARVERYDSDRQLVDVTPLVGRPYEDPITGERNVEYYGVITNVPVLFAGGGGFRQTFPIARGDTVGLLGMEASIDKWKHLGGKVDPLDDRRHHLSDVVAVLGLRPIPGKLSSAPIDCATMGYDGGAVIEYRQVDIRIGGGAGHEPTAKLTSLLSALNTLLAAIASAVGTSGDPSGATAAGAAITTAIGVFNGAAASFTSTIAKVK